MTDHDTTRRHPTDDRPAPGAHRPPAPVSGASGASTSVGIEGLLHDDQRYLLNLARQMLGDTATAEDVVQDALSRLVRIPPDEIDDRRGWLTVVVRRLSLNHLSSAYSRREAVAGPMPPEPRLEPEAHGSADPADRVTLDDQVRLALAIMLDRLTPAERTAFVLHDVFGFPHDSIAEIIGRTPAACRQLASRARRSLHTEAPPLRRDADRTHQHHVLVERFIAACAGGDISDLIAVLDPGIEGQATLHGFGSLGRVAGPRNVASRLIEQLGPGTGTSFLPIALDDRPVVVATNHHLAAVLTLEVVADTVRHIRSYVHRPT